MKPFTINRDSWHYKLNKTFMNEYEHNMEYAWEPRHDNFCAYWRATMFRVFGLVFFMSLVFSTCYAAGALIYAAPVVAAKVTASIITVILFLAAMVYTTNVVHTAVQRKKNKEPSQSLFAQKYRAHKEKICPMVEFK